ncbi:hypothetical protein N431DRAFT_526139 [Stipitochalara longipes BDJ]|nr:hypothetical protein N431DRAFT_526139 [Stipitochalara longipes BDJ]
MSRSQETVRWWARNRLLSSGRLDSEFRLSTVWLCSVTSQGLERHPLDRWMALDLLAKGNLASHSGAKSHYLRKHQSEVDIESSSELDLRPKPSTDSSALRELLIFAFTLISRKPRAGGRLSDVKNTSGWRTKHDWIVLFPNFAPTVQGAVASKSGSGEHPPILGSTVKLRAGGRVCHLCLLRDDPLQAGEGRSPTWLNANTGVGESGAKTSRDRRRASFVSISRSRRIFRTRQRLLSLAVLGSLSFVNGDPRRGERFQIRKTIPDQCSHQGMWPSK